jgi:hypothetical protein
MTVLVWFLFILFLFFIIVLLWSMYEVRRKYERFDVDDWKAYHKKFHTKALTLLKEVVDIGKKNNIICWIADGTLLGCIRHQGFIPWDNDIELAIFIPDVVESDINGIDLYRRKVAKIFEQQSGGQLVARVRDGIRLSKKGQDKNWIDCPMYILDKESGKIVCLDTGSENYEKDEVFPLQMVSFEDSTMPIPNKSSSFLERVYGKKCLQECVITKIQYADSISLFDYISLHVTQFFPHSVPTPSRSF